MTIRKFLGGINDIDDLDDLRMLFGPEAGDGGGHGLAFGDVNGDGREDVLCEYGWYERPAGNPFATRWAFHGETALPHPS